VADPEAGNLEQVWEEEWEKNLFDAALARVKQRADPKHLQIFDCYALKRLES
jgi:RNA polymerase sigma-70 factor (ECF subfamily)